MRLKEYFVTHPSLLIITITYCVIFGFLIYKWRKKLKKRSAIKVYEEIELIERTAVIRENENEYENIEVYHNQRNLDRASAITNEFQYFDSVSNDPTGEVVLQPRNLIYENING
ncbi:hypothetical protein RI129_007579 [Pyrocoelia pectoralis]|uniref:Uncharacterized protein n=1 Tax=Pyrocoelia pectoralis TaxID=417401 RepID=A0AAN7VCL8_9COLE